MKKRVKKVTKICLTKRSWIGYLYCRVCLSKEKDFASCILSTKNIFFLFLRMMIFFEKNGTFFTFCTFWQNAKTQKRKWWIPNLSIKSTNETNIFYKRIRLESFLGCFVVVAGRTSFLWRGTAQTRLFFFIGPLWMFLWLRARFYRNYKKGWYRIVGGTRWFFSVQTMRYTFSSCCGRGFGRTGTFGSWFFWKKRRLLY